MLGARLDKGLLILFMYMTISSAKSRLADGVETLLSSSSSSSSFCCSVSATSRESGSNPVSTSVFSTGFTGKLLFLCSLLNFSLEDFTAVGVSGSASKSSRSKITGDSVLSVKLQSKAVSSSLDSFSRLSLLDPKVEVLILSVLGLMLFCNALDRILASAPSFSTISPWFASRFILFIMSPTKPSPLRVRFLLSHGISLKSGSTALLCLFLKDLFFITSVSLASSKDDVNSNPTELSEKQMKQDALFLAM